MVANGLLLSHRVWFLSGSVGLFTELLEKRKTSINDLIPNLVKTNRKPQKYYP